MSCCDNICKKCHSAKMLVFGAVVLAVAQWWPVYMWQALGVLVILKGLISLAKPNGCGHCDMPAPAKKRK